MTDKNRKSFGKFLARTKFTLGELHTLANGFTTVGMTEAAEKINTQIRVLESDIQLLHFDLFGVVLSHSDLRG